MKSSASIALIASLVLAGCGGQSSNTNTDAEKVGFMGARWSATLAPAAARRPQTTPTPIARRRSPHEVEPPRVYSGASFPGSLEEPGQVI